MSQQIRTKEDITPEAVAALAERARLSIAPDRIQVIAQRLSELFDLAAPLEDVAIAEFEPTQPYDSRWTNEATA